MKGSEIHQTGPGTGVSAVRREAVAVAALAALVLLVYGPVTGFEFVNLDDTLYITGNSLVSEGFSPRSFVRAFATTPESFWGPLTWVSYMVDVNVHGFAPGGFHLTNLLLHLTAVVLFFLSLRLMTGSALQGFCAAALFAVHPLHVESVAWLAERKDVLSGFFFMLVLAAYVRYVGKPGSSRLAAVTILLALGLLAKPMLITAPVVLLLLDWWPLGRFARLPAGEGAGIDWRSVRPLLREKASLALLAATFAGVTLWTQRFNIVSASKDSLPMRLGAAAANTAGYLVRMVWPVGLAPTRTDTGQPYAWWQVAGAILLLTTLTVLAVRRARSAPFVLVGWLWYGTMLIPVSGLLQFGVHGMADHFVYLPLQGVYTAAAAGLGGAFRKGTKGGIAALAVLAAALLIFTGASRRQLMFWRDSESLHRRIAEVNPADYYALYLYGDALARVGRVAESVAPFKAALKLSPGLVEAHYALALSLTEIGDVAGSILHYQETVRLSPDHVAAHNNLGAALAASGRVEEARDEFRKAIGYDPGFAEAHYNLGAALEALGGAIEAADEYRRAVDLRPDYLKARMGLGRLLAKGGRKAEAAVQFRSVLERQPDHAEAREDLRRLDAEGEGDCR